MLSKLDFDSGSFHWQSKLGEEDFPVSLNDICFSNEQSGSFFVAGEYSYNYDEPIYLCNPSTELALFEDGEPYCADASDSL